MKKPIPPKIRRFLRKAKSESQERYGIGGREKKKKPAPITMPKIKFLEEKSD